jgi:hypothetical protein
VKIVYASSCRRTAVPTSWRPFAESNFVAEHECVIIPQMSNRRRTYEVLTFGVHWANFPRLEEAKAAVEEIYGPLPWQRLSLPKVEVVHYYFGPTEEFTDPTLLYVVDRLPRLATKHANLGARLWWRVHPEGREFMPETATSVPFFPAPGQERPEQGFSCTESPWHLWVYIREQFGYGMWSSPDTEVVGFTGTRVGTGNDGEPLVAPDMGVVARYSCEDFLKELIDTPFPPTPRGPFTWLSHYATWEAVAEQLEWADTGDPVEQHIIDSFGSKRAVAGLNGDLPTGLTLEVRNPAGPPKASQALVIAHLPGVGPDLGYSYEDYVGHLSWFTDTGMIQYVRIRDGYRRKGVATAMFDKAKEVTPSLHHSEDLTDDGKAWSQVVGSKTASYDGTLIARGLTLGVEKALAIKIANDTVTAQDFVNALMREGGMGVWWGVMAEYGDLEDFEDHASGMLDPYYTVKGQWEEYLEERGTTNYAWTGAECRLVLIAKRPTRDGQPWDPEIHNPLEAGGLMGNSYLADGEQIELVEVRYDAGWGWKSLPAQGIRTTAAQAGVYYHVSGQSNRASIEQHGLRGGDHGVWLYSDPERVRGIGKVWTPGHPFEEQDVWLVEPTEVVHGTEARDQTSAEEWGPDDPVWVAYEDIPPSRVTRVDNHTLQRMAAQAGVYYHVTSYKNWTDIRANGLRPGHDGHVWLFTEAEAAMRFKDGWDSSGWRAGVPPEEWKTPPCIVVVRTDRAVPTEAGIPGAYWVEGEIAKGEVFDVIRPGDLHHYAAKTAALPTSGLYWRTHDRQRPFSPEDASSAPLWEYSTAPTRTGYSCLENPWDLWVYLLAYGWLQPKFIDNDDVICFSGTRKRNKGNDGEPLVVPDMVTVNRLSWPEFEQQLLATPRPAQPGGPGARYGYYDNWLMVGNAAFGQRERSVVAAALWREAAEAAGVKIAERAEEET